MNVKYTADKKLNSKGQMILSCYEELPKLNLFMQELTKDYLKVTIGIDYNDFVKTIKSKAALETKLLKSKTYCLAPEENKASIETFVNSYIDVNAVKLSYSIDKNNVLITKKVGLNNKLVMDFFKIDKNKFDELNKTGFIEGYVDLVMRKEAEEELANWTFPDSVKASIGKVYKNEFGYTNIDINLLLPIDKLDSDSLIDISTFAMSFNEFFDEKYIKKEIKADTSVKAKTSTSKAKTSTKISTTTIPKKKRAY